MNRRDGIKVKDLDGMHSLMLEIMPKRCDSDVYISANIDVTNLVDYVNKLKKKEEYEHLTYFHTFCIAIGKLIYNRHLLNRFIINKTFYDRKYISLGFVAKKEFTDHSEEVFTSVRINKDDNLKTISDKTNGKVTNIRNNKTNNTDDLIDKVGHMPKFIRYIVMKIFKFMDNHDLLPESLTENLIYYQSALLSNLGSINCDSIYHHLTDFGTNEALITFGRIKDEPKVIDGKIEIRKMLDIGITIDERIADGFYFAKSLKLLEYIFENPKTLEDNADTIYDIKLR